MHLGVRRAPDRFGAATLVLGAKRASGATAKRLPFSSVLLDFAWDVICNTSRSGPRGSLCSAQDRAEPSKVQERSHAHC